MLRALLPSLVTALCLTTVPVTVSAAPSTRDSEEREDAVPVDEDVPEASGPDFSITFSLPLVFMPVVELMGEYRIVDTLGLAGVVGAGSIRIPVDDPDDERDEKRDEPFAYWEVGGQLRWYPIGDFEHGMQLGVELLYVGLHGENVASTSWDGTAHGISAGPFVGYKLATSIGFTFDAQIGASFLALVIHAENDGGAGTSAEETGTESGVDPLINLDLGWSF